MDKSVKETLRAVGLEKVSTSDTFVNFAVTILAKGKSGNIGNSAQLPYLAIHLSCLKNSVEFDVDYLQKKSTLNPKIYQSSLMALLRLIDPSTVINSESVAKYYGCPSLKGLIDEILLKSKEHSSEAVIAATYLIGHVTKLKVFGTLAAMAKLWGQAVEVLRELSDRLKVHCDADKLKDIAKVLTDEIKQSKQVIVETPQKRSSSPRSESKTAKMTKTEIHATESAAAHPLILFNCSLSGPAFGPIVF